MKTKISSLIGNHIALWITLGVAALCATFILTGQQAKDGSITLDGQNAKIEEYTEKFIENANDALYRIMNEPRPTKKQSRRTKLPAKASAHH